MRVEFKTSKGVSTVVAYMLIFVLVLSLTSASYLYVFPLLSNMKIESEFNYMTIFMKKLNDKIEAVARSGEGAKEYLTLNIEEGNLVFDELEDKVIYSIQSHRCMESEDISDLYFEYETNARCVNNIILNFTKINITNSQNFKGFFELSLENVGYVENSPMVKVG